MDCSIPSFPVLPCLPEFAQIPILSCWCCLTISLAAGLFFCFQSSPASGSFLVSWLFASGGQSFGASASVLPMNIQGWFYKCTTNALFIITPTSHGCHFFRGLSPETPKGEGASAQEVCPQGQGENREDRAAFLSPGAAGLLAAFCPLHHIFSLQANFVSNYLLCSWICWPYIWRTILYLLKWSKTVHILPTKSMAGKLPIELSQMKTLLYFISFLVSFHLIRSMPLTRQK